MSRPSHTAPLQLLNKHGRVIKPASRFLANNSLGNPFATLARHRKVAESAPRLARAPAAVVARDESSSSSSNVPAPRVLAAPELPSELELSYGSSDDDEMPALITPAEAARRQRVRSAPRDAATDENGEGWLNASTYRCADGTLEVDMRDSPYVADEHTKGWIAPGIYRHTGGLVEIYS